MQAENQTFVAPDRNHVYEALVARYRPAYLGVKVLRVTGYVLFGLGALALAAGVVGLTPHLLTGAVEFIFASVGFVATAFVARAVLDHTAFSAPGLTNEDRVRLAYEAGGEKAP